MAKENEKQRKSPVTRPYPRVSLEDSLKIAQAIKDNNGGNPWPPSEVATSIGASPSSSTFFYQTSASQGFGFTKGTRDASKIELEALGRAIVYAPSAEAELADKQKAFFSIDLFKKVFEHYGGSSLPETKYLSNTLQNDFGLHPDLHDEFVDLFKKNCKYLNLEASKSPKKSNGLASKTSEKNLEDGQTIVLSESGNKDALQAFVIMPFSEKTGSYAEGFFTEVLNSLVTPAAAEAGFTVRTARKTGSDVIQSTIINALIDADLVIADLTEHNPNVLFELGVRMALEKPILLIRARGTEKIFDVDNMLRVFDYMPNLWASTLKTDVIELTEHIKASWEQREEKNYVQILKGK